MPNDNRRPDDAELHGAESEDEPIPRASEEEVLEETVRMAREGRRELEADPRERKPGGD